jgi:hypothetical protein
MTRVGRRLHVRGVLTINLRMATIMKNGMEIKAHRVSQADYEANLANFKHSLFLTPEWVNSMATNGEAIFIHYVRNDTVVAKIAGLALEGGFFAGKVLLFYAGPALLEQEESLYDECLVALKRYAIQSRYSKINIGYNDQQNEWVFKEAGFYKRGLNEYVKHFDPTEGELKFGKSVMYNVRKAQKAGVTFHAENSERVLDRLFELLEETKRIRFVKYGKEYLAYPYSQMTQESVRRLFHSGVIRLYHAQADGIIHCVRCAMEKDKRMFGLMIGSDEFTYKNGVQQFVQYHIIRQLHEAGFIYYNIAGTAPGEEGKGLMDYKESLGCTGRNVFGAYTHFITFPHNLINPLMDFGRQLSKNKHLDRATIALSRFIDRTKSNN